MVNLAQLHAEQAQTRRTDIAVRLQGVLAANDRRLSPTSRRTILDAIGELSPVDPAAAIGLTSTNLQPAASHG